MFGWFSKERSLKERVNPTKKVKIDGVLFTIKQIDAADHLAGLRVLQNVYETKTVKGKGAPESEEVKIRRIREVCKNIILAGVVKPKIVVKPSEPDEHAVDEILKDFNFAQRIATSILDFTYKKKF